MGCDIRILAPAKVNFGLRVGQCESSGYHSIESVFQTISLCDTVTVREREGTGECAVFCGGKPMQERNTISLAYKAFAQISGADVPSVLVEIEKRIPIGGGLGGGSSDAAAFVAALERLTATVLTKPQKCAIASRVGCDVYFFLLSGESGCAVVTGRGDIVKPIRAREDLEMLLVFPPFMSATGEAYALLDLRRKEGDIGASESGKNIAAGSEELEEVYRRPVKDWTFVNDFTPSLSGRFPTVHGILNGLRAAGAVYCEMSGSGSTLYGVFDTVSGVERARLTLAEHLKAANDEMLIRGCRFSMVRPFGASHKMLDLWTT